MQTIKDSLRTTHEFENLNKFATCHPDATVSLIDDSGIDTRNGRGIVDALERIVLDQLDKVAFLKAVKAFEPILGPNVEATFRKDFIDALTKDAQIETERRLKRGPIHSLWGVSPIINLRSSVEADRLLGNISHSIVFETYRITRDFDINLESHQEWVLDESDDTYLLLHWCVFAWALIRYDFFHFYNDRGILEPRLNYGKPYFGIKLEELQLLNAAGKRLYTYIYGADHRRRQVTLSTGPINFCMDCPDPGKYCLCDDATGERMLDSIDMHATAMLACGVGQLQIPRCRVLNYLVIDVDACPPRYMEAPRDRPLRVAHVPNHPHFKGTKYALDAVERLQREGIQIEFMLKSDMSNEETLEFMGAADVVLDQLIGGSFGQTAVEAMTLGKPVISYVRDDVMLPGLQDGVPVINANPDTIYEVLRRLAENPEELPAIGRQSRKYAEKYLRIEAMAAELAKLYIDTGGISFRSSIIFQIKILQFRWKCKQKIMTKHTVHFVLKQKVYKLIPKLKNGLRRGVKFLKNGLRFFKNNFLFLFDKFVNIILSCAAILGRRATKKRLAKGHPRSLWGVTPILTLPLKSRCDRMLGLKSESLVFQTYYTSSKFDINLSKVTSRFSSAFVLRIWFKLVLAWALLRYDVFHYFYDRGILPPDGPTEPDQLLMIGIHERELDLLQRAEKRLYCYTYGADVRSRNRTVSLGKYHLCMDCPALGRYCVCSERGAMANFDRIRPSARAMLATTDNINDVPECRPFHYWALDLDRIPYVGVTRTNGPLIVGHAPNHAHFKGTRFLEAAVLELKEEGVDIELRMVTGVPNEKVIEIFAEADVIADQFILGGYGYTLLEGMARGKPVLCFFRNPQWIIAPEECPVIQTDPDGLKERLLWCVRNRDSLNDIGRKGRLYVVKYYSIPSVAARLGELYLETADFPSCTEHLVRKGINNARQAAEKMFIQNEQTVTGDNGDRYVN